MGCILTRLGVFESGVFSVPKSPCSSNHNFLCLALDIRAPLKIQKFPKPISKGSCKALCGKGFTCGYRAGTPAAFAYRAALAISRG